MPFEVRARIEGVEEAIQALRSLPVKVAKRALRQAVAAGTRKLAREAKNLAPVRKAWAKKAVLVGTLKRSLGSKIVTYPSGAVVGIVGVRKGFRRQVGTAKIDSRPGTRYPRKVGDPIYANPEKYLHLVELGTYRSRKVGFLERALRSGRPAFLASVKEAVDRAIARELAK